MNDHTVGDTIAPAIVIDSTNVPAGAVGSTGSGTV